MTSYRVILLCAGIGERLRPLTYTTNKSLLKVEDKTIIEHMIDVFISSGIDIELFQIIIGHMGYKFRKLLGSSRKGISIRFQENPLYDITGAAQSLYLTITSLYHGCNCIIAEGDYVLDQKLATQLIESSFENCVLVDTSERYPKGDPVLAYGSETNLIKLRWPAPYESGWLGEALTIFKTSKNSSLRLGMILKEYLLEDGTAKKEIVEPYNRLMKIEDFHWVSTQGAKWAEVDTEEDYERAKEMFKQ